jgi:hypothetical protein
MTRAELLDKIWSAVEPGVYISRREFMTSLEGWDVVPREIDGEIIGATLTSGAEFHFVTFGPRKAFTRALVIDCVQPIIDRYGFVRTRTPLDDARQRRFNLLVGFKVESTDEYFTHFRMERLNLRGAKSCQL